MNKATPIISLFVYPPILKKLLEEIILFEDFRPARKPIFKGEVPIRELGLIEKALFTIIMNALDIRSLLLSSSPVSPLELILAEKYRGLIGLLDEFLMNTIGLHPMTENIDPRRIGIRKGHMIVLLNEGKEGVQIPMFKENCMHCPSWSVCSHPGKTLL